MPNRTADRPGRNDRCHCGSGKKYKRCCLGKDELAEREARTKATTKATNLPTDGQFEPDAPKPQRPTDQTWKRGAHDYRPFKRFLTPRKRGGG